MNIYLDGQKYTIKHNTQIMRTPLIEFAQNIRTTGQQERKDRSMISSWAIEEWGEGFGIERMNVEVERDIASFWDAELDTRFPSFIVRSPKFQTCTIVPSRGNLDKIFNHRGDTYLMGDDGILFKYNSAFQVGSIKSITNSTGNIGGAVDALGYVFLRDVGGILRWSSPSLGVCTMVASISIVGSRADSEMTVFDGDKMAVITKNPLSYYLDVTNNIVSGVGTSVTRTSIGAVVGTYVPPLVTDSTTPYFVSESGVYDVTSGFGGIIDTIGYGDPNQLIMYYQGALYLKSKREILGYDADTAAVTPVGYTLDDGLPSDKIGEVTAWLSTPRWAFCAVKGASYSHILSFDGEVWGYYAKIPTMGLWVRKMMLSGEGGQDRLWCLFGNYQFPGFFINPLHSPLQAPTYSFVPTGHITFPYYDGGLSEEDSGLYNVAFTVDGVSAFNYMQVMYGTDGSTPIATLGIVASAPSSLDFGSGLGINAHRLQPQIILRGTTNSPYPVFRGAVVHYLKLPDTRETFTFTVDVNESHKVDQRTREQIIGSLNYVKNTKTLVPFWYGRMPTKNVRVLEMPSLEDFEDENEYPDEREAMVTVRLTELI